MPVGQNTNSKQYIVKRRIKAIVCFLAFQLIFAAITFPFLVFYGPFESIRNAAVGISINSSKYQFVARTYLSDNRIKDIMEKNSAEDPTTKGEAIQTLRFGSNNTNKIEVFDVIGNGFRGKLLVVSDPTSIRIGLSSLLPRSGETTSSISKKNNAVAAINAGGFLDNGWVGTGGLPMGYIIHEGKVLYNQLQSEEVKQDSAAFTKEGMLIVGKHSIKDLKRYGVWEGVSFGPPLIVNGKKTITRGDGGWGIAPRTAIGQRDTGEVLFLVIDGRNFNSFGATLKEVQEVLYEYGAVNAVNLDGGSSTTMFFNGKVINRPSDMLGERAVPSVFMVEQGEGGEDQ